MDGVVISVQDLLTEITAAFQASPLEVALIFGMIAALLAILIGYWLHSRRKERKRRRELDRERYQRAVEEHGLTEDDDALLDRLAAHLENVDKKHLLVSNKAIYNSCARKLLAEDPSQSDAVSSLRLRLGFRDARPDEAVSSTTEVPVGASVLLVPQNQRGIGAKVTAQDEDAMVVAPSRPQAVVDGQPIRVLYHNRAGVFGFATTVLSAGDRRARIDHSEEPEQTQRRRHFRQPVRRPAYIRPIGSGEPHDESEFLEIGGGGASIVNPYGKFAPGDDLEISFSPESDSALSVAGTVIRASKGGDLLHVRYKHIKESTRDRIYHLIFGASH